MGRPRKSLEALVREGTFRARRDTHRQLLGGPALAWPAFATVQDRYRQAGSEPERRAVALEFERIVAAAQAELVRRTQAVQKNGAAASATATGGLEAALARLGKAGSTKQLLGFFPAFLRHPKGR